MPTVFRTYHGHGTFNFNFGLQIVADFLLTARSDAWIEVRFRVPFNRHTSQIMDRNINRSKNPPEASLNGHVAAPGKGRLRADRLILDKLNFKATPHAAALTLTMVSSDNVIIDFAVPQQNHDMELRHGLTNFIFGGCLVSHTPTGGSRDKFTVTLEDLEVTYRQLPNYEETARSVSQDTVLTSESIVRTQSSDHEWANDVVEDSLILLSMASGNYIASIYEDTFGEGVLRRTILKSVKTMPYSSRDCCIDVRNLTACDLQIFLETAFPKYRTLKQALGLEIVIEYYLQAKRAELPELKYLIAVVGIECLLSYIPSYSRFGKWRKLGRVVSLIKKILGRRDRRSLREKTMSLLSHFSIPYEKSDLGFIRIRHSLVHTGRFPRSLGGIGTSDQLIHFLDRILLHILGFQGKYYLNRLNAFHREILP